MATGPVQKRLLRSRKDRAIAGVCSGVASYLGLDPTLVRLIFVILAVFTGGVFVVAYLVLWAIMPEGDTLEVPGQPQPPAGQEGAAPSEAGAVPTATMEPPVAGTGEVAPSARPRRQDLHLLGWVLLGVGLLVLLENLGAWRLRRFFWPALLIAVGLVLLWPILRRR